jgi:hypothetical protein
MLDEQDQLPYQHISDLIREKPVGLRVTPGKRYLVYTYQGKSTRLSLDGWATIDPTDPQTAFEMLQMLDMTPYEGKIGEWAYGCGYEWPERGEDPETRRETRAVWRYHTAVTERMKRLFGEDFQAFMQADINDRKRADE